MKTTLSVYDFRDAFVRAGRKDQFSYEALGLIYDYLEEIDSDYDLDVIGLCCELSEDTPESIAEYYSIDLTDCLYEEEILETVRDYLQDETTVIGTTDAGAIVYVQF
jgi:hypothetical protein